MATTPTTSNRPSTATSSSAAERGRGDTVREAADALAGATGEALDRLPAAAATTRDTLSEVRKTLTTGSDERLSAGTLLTFGFAMGLLLGGANRLLVLLALLPATAMGATLLDRGWRLQDRR